MASDADSGAKVQEIQELALNGNRCATVGGQVSCVRDSDVDFDEWSRGLRDGYHGKHEMQQCC
jgi:hypothetical protein